MDALLCIKYGVFEALAKNEADMKSRHVVGLVVLAGFAAGTGLLLVGQGIAALLVWTLAVLTLCFGERVGDYVLYANPIVRKRRETKERDRMETWRRATEWERGRVEREARAVADMHLSQMRQANRRTWPEDDCE